MKKIKIVLTQSKVDTNLYVVKQLQNRLTPAVGSNLSKKQVEELNMERETTIVIN